MCRRQKCFDFIQRHYSVILILTDFFFVYVVIGFFKGFYGVIIGLGITPLKRRVILLNYCRSRAALTGVFKQGF